MPNLDDEEAATSSAAAAAEPVELEAEALSRLGTTLAGKYSLEAVIGSGGMAHVYRATNTVINRTVAIKILRPVHATNGEIVERFLREARTANLVRHPNVVDMIDVAQDADGSPFIVQEYLEGETMAQYAARTSGIIAAPELIEYITAVLGAIAEAHELGVVHRDLKPENIFLAMRRGRRIPKVLDFGISKVRGAEMTTVGVMMGTPAYMAPELIRSSKDADPRSDIWAMGVLIFETLTGKVPFDGDTIAEILVAISTEDPARLSELRPDLPAGLSDIIARCIRRDPKDRYQNVNDILMDLEAVAAELKGGAPETSTGSVREPSSPDGAEAARLAAAARDSARMAAAAARIAASRQSGAGPSPSIDPDPTPPAAPVSNGAPSIDGKPDNRSSIKRVSSVPAETPASPNVLMIVAVIAVIVAAVLVAISFTR